MKNYRSNEHLQVPDPNMYKLGAWLCQLYFDFYGGLTYSGERNLDIEGPAILAPVHRSLLDEPAVCVAALKARDLHLYSLFKKEFEEPEYSFLSSGIEPAITGGMDRIAKRLTGRGLELEDLQLGSRVESAAARFVGGRTGRLFHKLGGIPIDRQAQSISPEDQPETAAAIKHVLENNGMLVVFPEATRLPELGDTVEKNLMHREGVLGLAATYGLPVVAVGVSLTTPEGKKDPFPTHVHFEEAFEVEQVADLSNSKLEPRKRVPLMNKATKPYKAELHARLQSAQKTAACERKFRQRRFS